MQIKYMGPSPAVNVAPYGSHQKGQVKTYPDEFGAELLKTSKLQQFEEVAAKKPGKKDE